MTFPPNYDNAWNEANPTDAQLANLLGQTLRSLKVDIRERMALLSGTFANRPANLDASFGGANYGLLFFATDTGHIYNWTGAAWTDLTSVFNPTAGIVSPGIVASTFLTGQAPVAGPTTILTYNTTAAGLYRASLYVLVTATGTGNFNGQVQWTDQGIGTVTSFLGATINFTLGNNTANQSSQGGASFFVHADNATAIKVNINCTGPFGAAAYAIGAIIEQLF